MRAAKAAGLNSVLAEANADGLLALGEAAQFARQPAVAERAFASLRSRFPASSQAGTATFHLARLFAKRGDSRRALSMLGTYRTRHPNGALDREVRGLQLELLHRARDGRRVKLAKQYLKRHPGGPHAGLAKKIITDAR